MIQIADMAAFAAVVETSSFTEAARRLGTTKSVISRRVGDLEEALGASLLDRSSRSVRSTEVGAVYYAKCVRILESIQAANDFVSGFHNLMGGRLRIVMPEAHCAAYAMPFLNEFATRFPELQLDVCVGTEAMNRSDPYFDVAVRAGKLDDSNLVARPLTVFTSRLCASPEYLAIHGEPFTPEDLADHHALIGSFDDSPGMFRLAVEEGVRTFRVRERLRSNDSQQLLAATMGGLGIAQIPDMLVAGLLESGHLKTVLTEYAPPEETLSAVFPKSRRNSQKVQALLTFLASGMPAI